MNAIPNRVLWPTCVECEKEYVPLPGIVACPWCSGRRHYDRLMTRTAPSGKLRLVIGHPDYGPVCSCGRSKWPRSVQCRECATANRSRR